MTQHPSFILSAATTILLVFCFIRSLMLKKSSFWSHLQQQKILFFIITYHSANSYHNFIYHSAHGFTASIHKCPTCVPVNFHTSPLTMKSYTKFLEGVHGARSLSSRPSFSLQVWLVDVHSASQPTSLKCWVCLVQVHSILQVWHF